MSDELIISGSFWVGDPPPPGAKLTPVNLFDGKPFFLESGPDGEPVLMMNVTKEYLEDFYKFWIAPNPISRELPEL